MEMLDDLIEDLGYEHKGKIKTYLLLLGSQTNEDELRLISKNSDTSCICAMQNGMMFFKNPATHLRYYQSYLVQKRGEAGQWCRYEHWARSEHWGMLFCRWPNRGRAIVEVVQDDLEEGTDDDSSDSDYEPEIVDSDYDLKEGDDDLVNDNCQTDEEKKREGKWK